jgi:D-alanine-D-alanine ligase
MIEELKNKKIGVLMGGTSMEREVSLKSGNAILSALNRLGYNAVGVVIEDDALAPLKEQGIELAFIALHGGFGEDGRIQALLEFLKIPYTGSGVVASALAMNKPHSKAIFAQRGIPTPRFVPALSEEFVFDEMKFSVPVVVKPSCEGSTVGVSIVRERRDFSKALSEAKRYDDVPMVEEFIDGREITCGVLDGEALEVVEIVPISGFYDYQAKYTAGGSEYIVPAKLEPKIREYVRELSKRAYDALHCQGSARVDFRLHPEAGPFVLEINTIPGMTERSLLPMSAKAVGIDFDELVERILKNAMVKKK